MSNLTGSQIRAARAALGWSIETLAERSLISARTIKRMEAGNDIPSSTAANLNAIQTTLEAAGIEFIGAPDDRPGVRIGRLKSTPDHQNRGL
jgi:transcriptional regulator with XRE-family HTH domain